MDITIYDDGSYEADEGIDLVEFAFQILANESTGYDAEDAVADELIDELAGLYEVDIEEEEVAE